jgi:hypothetical protein
VGGEAQTVPPLGENGERGGRDVAIHGRSDGLFDRFKTSERVSRDEDVRGQEDCSSSTYAGCQRLQV